MCGPYKHDNEGNHITEEEWERIFQEADEDNDATPIEVTEEFETLVPEEVEVEVE